MDNTGRPDPAGLTPIEMLIREQLKDSNYCESTSGMKDFLLSLQDSLKNGRKEGNPLNVTLDSFLTKKEKGLQQKRMSLNLDTKD